VTWTRTRTIISLARGTRDRQLDFTDFVAQTAASIPHRRGRHRTSLRTRIGRWRPTGIAILGRRGADLELSAPDVDQLIDRVGVNSPPASMIPWRYRRRHGEHRNGQPHPAHRFASASPWPSDRHGHPAAVAGHRSTTGCLGPSRPALRRLGAHFSQGVPKWNASWASTCSDPSCRPHTGSTRSIR